MISYTYITLNPGCPVPYYGHRSGPDRVLDGEEWTAACTDGFGVSTDVLVRKCTNNVLSPTLESNPVSCFKGLQFI